MANRQLAPVLHYLRKVTHPAASGDGSDEELLTRFSLCRDETAFAALVRRHGPMVLAVCRRVVRDGHAAEDAFQATFLVLACKAGSLTKPELLAHWLHGVAYRTAIKAKTAAAKRRVHERKAVSVQHVDSANECEWHDLRAVLDEEVNRLPQRYRVPVVLCYLQGQTNAEAARRLGCSRGTVATLLARARDKLRRRLTRRGVGLSVGFGLAALTPLARGGTVPLALEQGTVKAALFLVAGQVQAAGALASPAVALAKGVSKGMLMQKLRISAAIVMITAVVGAGAGLAAIRTGIDDAEVAETKSEAIPRSADKVEGPRKPITPHAEQPTQTDGKQAVRYDTENFSVTAPTLAIARQVGKLAEQNRKALARIWLDKELPTWPEPCPIRVTVSDNATNSLSTFQFQEGAVPSIEGAAFRKMQRTVVRGGMVLEGSLDKISADLLPHEMTHTILAEWRGRPIPRWADEGAAMLSESAAGRSRYEQAIERLLQTGRSLPLTELLPNLSYPRDVGAFYAQGFSLTDFLVTAGGRKKFLAFVARGQDDGWDKAAQTVYGYKSVGELEQTWLRFARMRLTDKRGDEPSGVVATEDSPSARPADKRSDEPSSKPHAGQSRNPKPRPAPAPGEALPSQFKEKLPPGPFPIQVLVVLDDEGRLSVSQKITYYQPETETVTLKNGQKHRVTYYDEKHHDYATVYDFRKVRVYDVTGQAVDASKLRKRLKKETLALVSANGRPLDPLHLRLFKENTLVFVLPPQQLPAMPGKDPIPPPLAPLAPVPVPVPEGIAPPPPVADPPTVVPPSGY